MSFTPVPPPAGAATSLPFSPAVRSGDLVFVSGQASVDEKGAIVEDTFEGEYRRSIRNLELVLEAAGATLADCVQVRAYVRDDADLPEFNRLYREAFPEPYPARTTLSRCLGAIKFEIDAIARV